MGAPFTRSYLFVAVAWCILASVVVAQPTERKVAAATRLDWQFAVQGFGPGATKLPAGYDSTKQRYQLYVPKSHSKDKPASLVLFISASDQPAGWNSWKSVCEKEGILFASPFGAGNSPDSGRRTRVILDVLDDVRRQYAIDPDQTYITGFSGGGRMACSIGFALPEYFGGVIPLCGTNPISGPTYLRHRIEERLSVAFVTGEKDFNRKENEVYLAPWFDELGIRSKLWVVPKMGHDIPPASVVSEVHAWLAEDLKRRRAEAQARPKLAVAHDLTPTASEQAARQLESALDDLKQPTRTWRGVALVQGVTQRWGKTEPGKRAQALLKEIVNNDKLLERVEVQGAEDEVKSISAQAKALERFGQTAKAIEAWQLLAKNYEGTPIASRANDNIKRLRSKGQ